MARIVTIPKGFYDDHVERGLPAPPIVRRRSRHYEIDTGHPDFPELMEDASFYADPWGPDAAPNIRLAAFAFLRAVQRG